MKNLAASHNRGTLALILLGLGLAILIIGPSLARSASMGNSRAGGSRVQFIPQVSSTQSVSPGENKSGEADDQNERAEYWADRLGLQFGVQPLARQGAISSMQEMEKVSRNGSGLIGSSLSWLFGSNPPLSPPFSWSFIGPQPMLNALTNFGGPITGANFHASGRVSSIAADPTLSGRIFVGGASGGVWMSTDGGVTYVPIFNAEPTQVIGAIALDAVHTSPPTIYVATGEGNNAVDSYYGHGIFKSTNLGQTWSSLGGSIFDQVAFTRLAVDTSHNPPFLFAAANSGISGNRADAFSFQGNPANQGFWRSTDGGATWFNLNGGDVTCNGNPCATNDVVLDPVTPSHLYANVQTEDVFISTDSGNSFFASNIGPLFGGSGGIDRVSLAVGPPAAGAPLNCAGKQCGIAYAMVGSGAGSVYQALFKSTDGGATWISATVPSFANGLGTTIDGTTNGNFAQEFYDQTMLVSPSNAGVVIFGGVGIYETTNFGATWSFLPGTKGGVHSDQHALAIGPDKNTVFLGNDGGAFKFTLTGISGGVATFIELNDGLSTGQMQGIGPHPTNNTRVLAGYQDNGTQLYTGTLGWNSVTTGDGGFALFDHLNPAFAYHTLASGGGLPVLAQSTDSGNTWNLNTPTASIQTQMKTVGDPGAIFYPPLASDPGTAGRVFFGGHHIYVSTNGMTSFAEQETADLTGAGCTSGGCALEDIEFAPSDHTKAWALAAQSGAVPFRLLNTTTANVNSGGSWADVTSHLPFSATLAQATSIAPDPNNAANAFLGVSGFRAATSVGHVFRTVNFGAGWTEADGFGGASPLPDIPVTKVMVDRSDATGKTVLAGTDIGVFRSTDAGATWAAFNLGTIPAVPIFDLQQNNNNVIFAGTHGRGGFKLNSGAGTPTPTHTPLPTHTPIPHTPTHTPARTPIPTHTPLGGHTPTHTPIAHTPAPTHTPSGPTHTPAKTATHTPAKTATHTPAKTPTHTPARTPIPTPTPGPITSAKFTLNLGAPLSVPGCVDSGQLTFSGAALGNVCTASMSVAIAANQELSCHVVAANSIDFRVCQFNGTATDPDGAGGATYRAVLAH